MEAKKVCNACSLPCTVCLFLIQPAAQFGHTGCHIGRDVQTSSVDLYPPDERIFSASECITVRL